MENQEIVETEEPLQKPKAKRTYTPEQVEKMKENLAKGREARKTVQQERKEVLDLHTKLIEKKTKNQQLKEKLERDLEKEPEPAPVPEKLASEVAEAKPKVKKIPKVIKVKQEESDDDSVEIVIEKKPKRRVVYVEKVEKEVEKPLPPPEKPKYVLRFV